jgi:transcriptional regulator with XRE-family HTH domain
MNTELAALGVRVRRLRREVNISQEELAERCALHRTYVSDLERGSRNPSFLSLLALARGLGISISELTRDPGTDGPKNTPEPGSEDPATAQGQQPKRFFARPVPGHPER